MVQVLITSKWGGFYHRQIIIAVKLQCRRLLVCHSAALLKYYNGIASKLFIIEHATARSLLLFTCTEQAKWQQILMVPLSATSLQLNDYCTLGICEE